MATTDLHTEGLALHSAGTCDGCGHDAVELAILHDEDCTLHYCRPCMGDDDMDPSLEWIVGEPVATTICDICHQSIVASERFHDDGDEIAHTACIRNWFRGNYGRESLAS